MKQEVPGPYACYDMTEPKPAPRLEIDGTENQNPEGEPMNQEKQRIAIAEAVGGVFKPCACGFCDYAMKGQIRFLRGRLKFGGAANSAPFLSAVVVFANPSHQPPPNGGRLDGVVGPKN